MRTVSIALPKPTVALVLPRVLPVVSERFVEVSHRLGHNFLQEYDRELVGLDNLCHFLVASLEQYKDHFVY